MMAKDPSIPVPNNPASAGLVKALACLVVDMIQTPHRVKKAGSFKKQIKRRA